MKALIFNSGTGSRMGELTKYSPKALVKLANGETILGRQIRILRDFGIDSIIITTGPFHDQIESFVSSFSDIKFKLINSDKYKETNSMYSMYLVRNELDEDMVILHGDLVFNKGLLEKLINFNKKDICLINKSLELPKKDFKGLISNGNLKKISVDLFTQDSYAFQPLYKLSKKTVMQWLKQVEIETNRNNVRVYAENALNNILDSINIYPMDYNGCFIDEIDNQDDLERINNSFRTFDYLDQRIIKSGYFLDEINSFMLRNDLKKPLFVFGDYMFSDKHFMSLLENNSYHSFTTFSPNPKYEEALEGVKIFINNACDSIIAIGGGSCLDIAKTIKLFSSMNHTFPYIEQTPTYSRIKMMAIPTTAGTGSESTRFAVIYYQGVKQSLVHDSLLPDKVILDSSFLKKLPLYHKKATLLDAFCQAIESYWSVNSTEYSKDLAKKALLLIINNYKKYITNDENSDFDSIMLAANYAGKAINITETTAPHAMSYIVTSICGIAHGHAVAIILPHILKYMINNLSLTVDKRGKDYLSDTFLELSAIFNLHSIDSLETFIEGFIKSFDMSIPKIDSNQIEIMTTSVNKERLKNNPVSLSNDAIKVIYQLIFV